MWKMIAAVTLLSAGLPGIAPAQEVRPDVHVSYHDLDLNRADDVRTLDHRLRKAIEAVCPDDRSTERWTQIAALRCRKAKYAQVAGPRAAALTKAAAIRVASAR